VTAAPAPVASGSTVAASEIPSSFQLRAESESPTSTLTPSRSPVSAQSGSQGLEAIAAPIRGGLDPSSVADDAVVLESDPSAAVALLAGKGGAASGGRSSTQAATRQAQGIGSVEHRNQTVGGQPAGTASAAPAFTSSAMDTSAVTRDPAGVHAPMNATGNTTGGSIIAPGARDTFAALDAEDAASAPTWVHAGTRSAEAGYEDPALGWVGVRADMSGGGVHASLVPGSADAAQALGSQMAGLNTYLTEHRTPVESLTLAAPESRWIGQGADQETNQGMQQGTGQNSGQEAGQGAYAAPQSASQAGTQAIAAAASSDASALAQGPDAIAEARREGVHISVMA